ncbi:MAG: Lon-like protease helical domain-containing protein [Clostridia bacterium]
MKNKNELTYKDLKMSCNPNIFHFETTADLEPIQEGIGQDRGIKALEFGLQVDVKGYNLYLEGPSGVGKTMYTKNYLQKIALKKKAPSDWCYIYNFDNPNEPIAVELPAGQGKEFKESMDGFIKEIKKDIQKTFNNDDFEKEKALIKQEYEAKRSALLDKLNQDASKYNFQVKAAQNGIYMMPIVDGKAIEEEEFEKLDDSIKQQYEEKSVFVQEQIMNVIGQIKEIERQSDKKISEWQSNVALLTVNVHINFLKSKYKRNKKINQFLNNVKKDVLKNIPTFLEDTSKQPQSNQQVPNVKKADPCLNYRVNLFVDNSNREGVPVIMDSNYSYNNIFGTLEYENYYGALKTDHTMLKPGLMQQANRRLYYFPS